MSRTLVIGVGNALRGDDAAGLHVARRLAARACERRRRLCDDAALIGGGGGGSR